MTNATTPRGPVQDLKIGNGDEPTRVLVFAGGAFETARQLGAVHAIMA
jgi:hypothetical protein